MIDEQGNIAYCKGATLTQNVGEWDDKITIDKKLKTNIEAQLQNILKEQLSFTPAVKDGQPVNVRLSTKRYVVAVTDHKVSLIERRC